MEPDDDNTGYRAALPTCQYGVHAATEEGMEDCGEPAVATWSWGGDLFYVCEKHDREVALREEDAASGES